MGSAVPPYNYWYPQKKQWVFDSIFAECRIVFHKDTNTGTILPFFQNKDLGFRMYNHIQDGNIQFPSPFLRIPLQNIWWAIAECLEWYGSFVFTWQFRIYIYILIFLMRILPSVYKYVHRVVSISSCLCMNRELCLKNNHVRESIPKRMMNEHSTYLWRDLAACDPFTYLALWCICIRELSGWNATMTL